MSARAAEARRLRLAAISRLTALRANFDREAGLLLADLHKAETMELEASREERDLNPEFLVRDIER